MTAYVDASAVAVLLPRGASVGASTLPLNLGEVGSIAFEISAEVDAAAAEGGYAVPVSASSPAAYAQLQRAVKTGVLAAIMQTLAPGMPGVSQQKATFAGELRREYEDIIARLRKGELVLVGAARETTETYRALGDYSGRPTGAVTFDRDF